MQNSVTRRNFLKKSAVTTGAIAVAMASPAALFGQEVVMAQSADLDILNFAYTLEVVAVDAYTTAAKSGLLPAAALAVGTKFAGQHGDHANALAGAIKQASGKDAVAPKGPFNYPQFKNATDILNFAKTLEEVAVGAYYSSIGKIQNPAYATAAASIVGVEAQHVAVLAGALGMDPIPNAFVTGTAEADVTKIATSILTKPAGGQGGGTPAMLPSSGVGGGQRGDDYTGAVLGLLGTVSAAAAVLLMRRKNSAAVSTDSTEE